MSLVIAPPKQVKCKVAIHVPRENAVGNETQHVTATIKKLYGQDKESFIDSVGERNDIDVIRELCTDITGFLDADRKAIPFSDDLLEQIKDIDYIVSPLTRECISVQDEAMRKLLNQKN